MLPYIIETCSLGLLNSRLPVPLPRITAVSDHLATGSLLHFAPRLPSVAYSQSVSCAWPRQPPTASFHINKEPPCPQKQQAGPHPQTEFPSLETRSRGSEHPHLAASHRPFRILDTAPTRAASRDSPCRFTDLTAIPPSRPRASQSSCTGSHRPRAVLPTLRLLPR